MSPDESQKEATASRDAASLVLLQQMSDTRNEIRALRDEQAKQSAEKKKPDPWWTKAVGILGIPVLLVGMLIQFNQYTRESAPANQDKLVAEARKIDAEREKTLAEAEKVRAEIQAQHAKGALVDPALQNQTLHLLGQLEGIVKEQRTSPPRLIQTGTIAAIGIFLVLFLNRCFGLLQEVVGMLAGAALNYVAMFLGRRRSDIWRKSESESERLEELARTTSDHSASRTFYDEADAQRGHARQRTRRIDRAIEQVYAARTLTIDAIHVLFIAVGVFSVFAIYGGVYDSLASRAGVKTRTTDVVRLVYTGHWKRAFQEANAVLGSTWSGGGADDL